MNILLTGEIQVGKTTVIKRILDETGLTADGFRTYWRPSDDGGTDLFIRPYGDPIADGMVYKCAHRLDCRRSVYPEAFDSAARSFLSRCGRKDIIILDELGFMENDAKAFQETVLSILRGSKPVLGVIKPRSTPFLDAVRGIKDVETVNVTVENREKIFSELIRRYKTNTLF